ncbi:MAG: hypothetical protein CMH57_01955 [Myxococcales bacterium]|nr:hypothetical protein [Myxococcales bacterium]
MIVVCERCSSKYRINEDKLPTGGGNIKCPSCQHVFFVAPPNQAPPSSQLPRRPGGMADMDDGKTVVGTVPSALLGNTPGGASGAGDATMIGAPPGFAAAASAASTNPMAAADEDDDSKGWKLKTNFGLIYEFPDTDSLRNWLAARDNPDGYKLSRDGMTFKDLSSYPDLTSGDAPRKKPKPPAPAPAAPMPRTPAPSPSPPVASKPRGAAGIRGATPSPGRPPGPGPAQRNNTPDRAPVPVVRAPVQLPPSRNEGSSTAVIASLLVLLLLGVLGLQMAGVIDLRGGVAKKREAARASMAEERRGQGETNLPAKARTDGLPVDEEYEEEEEEGYVFEDDFGEEEENSGPDPRKVPINPLSHGGHVQTLLQRADSEMRDGDYNKAVATLNMAKGLDPRNPSIYRRLEDAYDAMGNTSGYEEARSKRRALEGQ